MNSLHSISSLVPLERHDQIILSFLSFAEHHSGHFPSFAWQMSQLYFLYVSHRAISCEIDCPHNCMTLSFNSPIMWNWISLWCRFHNIFSYFQIQHRLTVLLLKRAGSVPTFVKMLDPLATALTLARLQNKSTTLLLTGTYSCWHDIISHITDKWFY